VRGGQQLGSDFFALRLTPRVEPVETIGRGPRGTRQGRFMGNSTGRALSLLGKASEAELPSKRGGMKWRKLFILLELNGVGVRLRPNQYRGGE
jgi:hypothetical protein